MFVVLPDTRGDPSKRTCRFYAACQNWEDVWEDERGTQTECKVCGATLFCAQELADED